MPLFLFNASEQTLELRVVCVIHLDRDALAAYSLNQFTRGFQAARASRSGLKRATRYVNSAALFAKTLSNSLFMHSV